MSTDRVWRGRVLDEWVDYNGHMSDVSYVIAFSQAYEAFLDVLGFDARYAQSGAAKIFTLEAHISYLREAFAGEELHADCTVVDCDHKSAHLLFGLHDSSGQVLSYYEIIFMHVQREKGRKARPLAMPDDVGARLAVLRAEGARRPLPAQMGSVIRVRSRSPKHQDVPQ